MAELVGIAGAFRGPWYWAPLAEELDRRGHRLRPVALTGTGDRTAEDMRDDHPDVSMGDWVNDVVESVRTHAADPVTLVGHSMGGIVAQAAAPALGSQLNQIILLDSPLISSGQRAVDVSGPIAEELLPDRSTWIPPTPVGAAQGFEDPGLAAWVNERLHAVPMGPQLDPVETVTSATISLVFFDRTPEGYPSTVTRRRCERKGTAHVVLDQHHDAPLLAPEAIAELLDELLDAPA